jgi:hypothetical protein
VGLHDLLLKVIDFGTDDGEEVSSADEVSDLANVASLSSSDAAREIEKVEE